jgi:regulator of cell morphogenesis and NO signaling
MFDPDTPVATIVLDHSECAAVFTRHRIDFCCVGTRALSDACRERHLNVDSVLDELEVAVKRRTARTFEPRSMPTRQLIKEVIGRHHRYLHRTLPFLSTLVGKVVRLHGDRQPSLLQVRVLFGSLHAMLLEHLHEEEHALFPALLGDSSGDVMGLLSSMRSDHEVVTSLLAVLRTAASEYQAPTWACAGYRTLMRELGELEADTLRHLEIEEEVLMPRFQTAA